jgi:thiamine-monophosphate kinase
VVGAEIELSRLPLSNRFRAALEVDPQRIDLALTGGEDYELLFTSKVQDLSQRPELQPAVTRIGVITTERGINCRRPDAGLYQCSRGGFDHFA